MNASNENEKPADTREARTPAPVAEPFETKSAPPPQDSTDEGGYGWGV